MDDRRQPIKFASFSRGTKGQNKGFRAIDRFQQSNKASLLAIFHMGSEGAQADDPPDPHRSSGQGSFTPTHRHTKDAEKDYQQCGQHRAGARRQETDQVIHINEKRVADIQKAAGQNARQTRPVIP